MVDLFEETEMYLCEKLDGEVYLPTKIELAGNVQYNLGYYKENFKMTIHKALEDLKAKLALEQKEKNRFNDD